MQGVTATMLCVPLYRYVFSTPHWGGPTDVGIFFSEQAALGMGSSLAMELRVQ